MATTQKAPLPEVWGAREVAKELGVDVSNIDRVSGLPSAFQRIASGRLWLADDIRAFAAERRARKAAGGAKRKRRPN